jgi:hypothetical protein
MYAMPTLPTPSLASAPPYRSDPMTDPLTPERQARDRMVDEVREATRTLSDAYHADPAQARRWAQAVDRIHLAVAEYANVLATLDRERAATPEGLREALMLLPLPGQDAATFEATRRRVLACFDAALAAIRGQPRT